MTRDLAQEVFDLRTDLLAKLAEAEKRADAAEERELVLTQAVARTAYDLDVDCKVESFVESGAEARCAAAVDTLIAMARRGQP